MVLLECIRLRGPCSSLERSVETLAVYLVLCFLFQKALRDPINVKNFSSCDESNCRSCKKAADWII